MDNDSLITFANGGQDSIWVFALGDLSITDIAIPDRYELYPAYLNPFNPITNIKFALPENVGVNIVVYDINGRIIETTGRRIFPGWLS